MACALKRNINFRISVIATFLLFSLCGNLPASKIKPVEFSGFSEIFEGDTALIVWKFENADRVKVEGFDYWFRSADTVRVVPESTRSYSFTAYQNRTSIFGKDDSLVAGWRVYVKPSGAVKEIQTGLKAIKAGDIIQSDYFTGIDLTEATRYPTKIKILRTEFTDGARSECVVNALFMDDAGKYIPGLDRFSDNIYLSAIQYCAGGKLETAGFELKENKYSPAKQNNYSIVVENSLAASNNLLVWAALQEYFAKPDNNDVFSISYFNHNLTRFIAASSAENIAKALDNADIPEPNGLTGFYKAAFNTLSELANTPEGASKALIIIAYSPDNSSVLMDIADVVTLAINTRIPIYTIAIGENAETFALKYMASATGGRYYSIPEDFSDELTHILKEINFSGKASYSFKLKTHSLNLEFCEKLKSEISIRTVAGIYNDEWRVTFKPETHSSLYQALAAFDVNDASIDETFREGIEALAKVMIDNPGSPISISGHASPDETANAMELSLRRAQAVRRSLIENGVPSSKIRIRGEGATKPLYYFQSLPWQQYYNRRAEIRWLDPLLMPFEIVAAQTWTEEDALQQVEEWEKRGCRSYFERYIVGENPAYKVKLWGFRTIDEAREAAKTLERKYRQRLIVD